MKKDHDLFNKIRETVEQGLKNLENDSKIKLICKKYNVDYDASIEELRKSIYDELNQCVKNVKEKTKNEGHSIKERAFWNSDNKKYDIFVIVPVYNATNEQAEK